MNIQFGSGSNLLPCFRNTDINAASPDDRIDITKPLPFASDSVDIILAEHICEHVSCGDCLRFFDECFRILRPHIGVLRVCVPILDRIIDRAHQRDLVLGHGHAVVMDWNILFQLLQLAGFEKDDIEETIRDPIDGHWKTIGREKDQLETLRVEARKP